MRTPLLVAACLLAGATAASAQQGSATYAPRQTAMGALGQIGVLNNSQPTGPSYRVAARNGVGAARGGQAAKPFLGANSGPTISPYLNLFRDETSDSSLPNYYTFVRPQQQQYEANQQQRQQLQQLQRQVQQATYTTPATNISGGARFGDTSRFYRGWRR
ncbi:hypothetical protein MalM25_01410 [Planctomycetes bacterium MalM25]|nr:hypothetical protein MalM25_01410 [Planctomycetes bacterium MalM25]